MRRLLVLPLALGLTGCFFPADRGQLLESRVDKLSDENKRLKGALAETQGKLDDTTAQLKTALEQLDQASRTTGANIGVKVDGAIQDVATLRGQMESYQFKITELEARLAAAEKSPGAAPTPGKPEEPKKDELKKPDDPKDFLKLADDKAKAGENELAKKLYAEFLKKWPRDELAGEAHFGLGEVHFLESKCREALYEYGKVIQDHPKSKAAPQAYLRSADCFKELKMIDEAKLALNELLKTYAKSEQAKLARARLAELEKKPAPAAPKGGKK
ncbi:MAG: tetratricopeptide repeat protein [Myxococcaceae bacterium]|nr:tetratricopeptide repeat protein [Myxococcaceae bacterium]